MNFFSLISFFILSRLRTTFEKYRFHFQKNENGKLSNSFFQIFQTNGNRKLSHSFFNFSKKMKMENFRIQLSFFHVKLVPHKRDITDRYLGGHVIVSPQWCNLRRWLPIENLLSKWYTFHEERGRKGSKEK